VRQFEPLGAFVVEVREVALHEPGLFGGGGHDGRLADEGPGVGWHVGEVVRRVDPGRQRVEPLRQVCRRYPNNPGSAARLTLLLSSGQ